MKVGIGRKAARAKIDRIASEIKKCVKCKLWKSRSNTVPGEGSANARLVFIGEGPGKEEDRTGRPFVGQSGRLLTKLLSEAGIKREEVFITSCVKCRPPKNRKPQKDELHACFPYLKAQIEAIEPKIVVLLGLVAVDKVIGDRIKMQRLHGQIVTRHGRTFFITYHPAAARRFQKIKGVMEGDLRALKRIVLRQSKILNKERIH